jgi:two-component system, LytTR family, response regulator
MKIIIIEDEDLAAEGLSISLKKIDKTIEIIAILDSVKMAVDWFQNNPAPDLAFFDIQLADGVSFEIFEKTAVKCPVIFTTAYDEYALRAFKVNSIDYLLKPVSVNDLKNAFEKWQSLKGTTQTSATAESIGTSPYFDDTAIRQMMQMMTQRITSPQYKTRFMVKIGEHLQAFAVEDIEYFYGENKTVWLRHRNGRKYVIDYTLEQLEDILDPMRYFRINRKYITAIESITNVTSYSNSRLKIQLKEPPDKEDILISREKVETFKNWLGK